MNCEFCDEPAVFIHLLLSYAKPEYYCRKHGTGCEGCRLIERKEYDEETKDIGPDCD